MKGYRIASGFIDFVNTAFECPHCKKAYNDDDERFYKKISKNKSYIISHTCECGNKFEVTISMVGDYVAFKAGRECARYSDAP